MGECLIARGQAGSSGGIGWKYKTEIITQNSIWEVPDAIDLSRGVSVRIFGGGGGGFNDSGGGGGYMNNDVFDNFEIGQRIKIIIADGGNIGKSGGTSYFGNYLSANGGTSYKNINGPYSYSSPYTVAGSGGSGGGSTYGYGGGGRGYQFGGGGGIRGGGDGGYWGGGGGAGIFSGYVSSSIPNNNKKFMEFESAGNGGYYGGGGGICSGQFLNAANTEINTAPELIRGFGGYYGGGGGGLWYNPKDINNYGLEDIAFFKGGCIRSNTNDPTSKIIGHSGFGGNGSVCLGYLYSNLLKDIYNATNGTDTSTWTNVFNDGNGYFRGKGLGGNNGGGGGGYGGSGGSGIYCNTNQWYSNDLINHRPYFYGGGGGGYGGNGGNAGVDRFNYHDTQYNTNHYWRHGGGGGGGGFGGDGGDGGVLNERHGDGTSSPEQCGVGGGGGGYGKSAKGGSRGGGGGGYYGKGGNNGGGGGGYGDGGDGGKDGIYGGGGGRWHGRGGTGICIIQYYAKSIL